MNSVNTHKPQQKWGSGCTNLPKTAFVNIVGGCCGSQPEHIETIAKVAAEYAPREPVPQKRACRLSGLEAFNITSDSLFVNVGERTNVTGSRRFETLIKDEGL